jgi:hypothetical protein
MRAWFYNSLSAALLDFTCRRIAAGDQRFGSHSHIGKNVEVRGLVISVTTSPLGTACISFGREYPDQVRRVHRSWV